MRPEFLELGLLPGTSCPTFASYNAYVLSRSQLPCRPRNRARHRPPLPLPSLDDLAPGSIWIKQRISITLLVLGAAVLSPQWLLSLSSLCGRSDAGAHGIVCSQRRPHDGQYGGIDVAIWESQRVWYPGYYPKGKVGAREEPIRYSCARGMLAYNSICC